MKRHTTKQSVIFFLIKKNNRNEFHLKSNRLVRLLCLCGGESSKGGGTVNLRRRERIGQAFANFL